MKRILLLLLTALVFTGCKKQDYDRVDIYLLKSWTQEINSTTNPGLLTISNAVLEDRPLVSDPEIKTYDHSSTSFQLYSEIKPVIAAFGPEKAFAVTLNGTPVYYGKFHPAYLSSTVIGVATIDPLLSGDYELPLRFIHIQGNAELASLDKRNHPAIIESFRRSGRLR